MGPTLTLCASRNWDAVWIPRSRWRLWWAPRFAVTEASAMGAFGICDTETRDHAQ